VRVLHHRFSRGPPSYRSLPPSGLFRPRESRPAGFRLPGAAGRFACCGGRPCSRGRPRAFHRKTRARRETWTAAPGARPRVSELPLVRIADVDEVQRVARAQPALELGRLDRRDLSGLVPCAHDRSARLVPAHAAHSPACVVGWKSSVVPGSRKFPDATADEDEVLRHRAAVQLPRASLQADRGEVVLAAAVRAARHVNGEGGRQRDFPQPGALRLDEPREAARVRDGEAAGLGAGAAHDVARAPRADARESRGGERGESALRQRDAVALPRAPLALGRFDPRVDLRWQGRVDRLAEQAGKAGARPAVEMATVASPRRTVPPV
jgi:hypothetical protein